MGSTQPSVLVSHDLHVYAVTLVSLLAQLRPHLNVQHVLPVELDEAVQARTGAIVVSSRLSSAVETHAGGWLLYYPAQANIAVVSDDKPPRQIENPGIPDILGAIDGLIARLARLVPGRSTGVRLQPRDRAERRGDLADAPVHRLGGRVHPVPHRSAETS